jgi:hypothetical protein
MYECDMRGRKIENPFIESFDKNALLGACHSTQSTKLRTESDLVRTHTPAYINNMALTHYSIDTMRSSRSHLYNSLSVER